MSWRAFEKKGSRPFPSQSSSFHQAGPEAELLLAQRDLFASRVRFIGRVCYMQIVVTIPPA